MRAAGVRLWVHDECIIDQWSSLASTAPHGTVWLRAGALADLKLEYSARAGLSSLALQWKSSSQTKQAVPGESLFSLPKHVSGSPFALTVYPAGTSAAAARSAASLGSCRGMPPHTRGVPRCCCRRRAAHQPYAGLMPYALCCTLACRRAGRR